MLDINHVLFPTDFSEGAEPAFPRAMHFAKWHDATLHILNVQESAQPDDLETTRSFPIPLSTMQGWLDRAAGPDEEASSPKEVDIEQTQIDSDAPPEAIADYVDEKDIDLVVMGTHGRRGLDRVRFGSVTEEVVRTAAAPVLTVRADSDLAALGAVRRVLVPIDFSDASEVALRHAKEIALTYGAEIDLLHVVDEPVYPSAYGDTVDFPGQVVAEEAEDELANLARDIIGVEHAMAKVVVGHPVEHILKYVEENEVDLLVMATHGRTGLNRLMLGSVSEKVLRQSPIPVFLVKPEEASLLSETMQEPEAKSA